MALVWAWVPLVVFVAAGFVLAGWSEITANVWRTWLVAWRPEMSPQQVWAYVRVARKLVHVLAYGLLAILALRATDRTWQKTWPVLTILAVGIVAVLDELNQSRLPQRTSTTGDVLFDLAGATMAVALWQVVRGK